MTPYTSLESLKDGWIINTGTNTYNLELDVKGILKF
jgi:hypothetical protein